MGCSSHCSCEKAKKLPAGVFSPGVSSGSAAAPPRPGDDAPLRVGPPFRPDPLRAGPPVVPPVRPDIADPLRIGPPRRPDRDLDPL